MENRKNILLYPVSLIYGIITGIRNFLYNTGIFSTVEFHLPVICVGNITVGGTGKTPHTEYLAGLLRENFRVATLSRGYKRKTHGFRIASPSSNVSEIGDEPMQISRKYPDVLVTVDRNRVHGVKMILQEKPDTDVIILDDGFQHRSITPGYSILLSDFERPFTRDHMLPYGNLREHISNMRRADIILITKSPENIPPIQRRLIAKEVDKAPYQNLYFTSLAYKMPVPLFEDPGKEKTPLDLSVCTDCGIVLITGIANPAPLKEYLQKIAGEIIHLSFPDHYNFKEKDIENILTSYKNLKSPLKYLFTTEKDAVRLREFANIAELYRSVFYYIPVGIKFLHDDKDEFDNLIIDYVRKNKRNNRVSESKRNNKS
ncbi:MAG: tetraacyldisaccharide 4'-kinase [Bacteroidales bacterium]|nr:tetraacyldisaccharide 4'-kinase [Bacteroidales bacterium]